jgi:hypothetical protein
MGWGELVVQNVGARTVSSCRELLDIREAAWRPLLRRVSLVAEAEIPQKHRTQAAVGLGHYYKRSERIAEVGLTLLARWPACLILAMRPALEPVTWQLKIVRRDLAGPQARPVGHVAFTGFAHLQVLRHGLNKVQYQPDSSTTASPEPGSASCQTDRHYKLT